MADKHTIEQRIAHFLKLAEDTGATQAERDLASSQAERLMIKHAIDRASIAAAAEKADPNRVEPIVRRDYDIEGTYAMARLRAAYSVVVALQLDAYHSGGATSGGKRLVIVGHESDVDEAVGLLRSLDTQAAVAMRQHFATPTQASADYWRDRGQKAVARRSFLEGFGTGAGKRIRESRQRVIVEAESTTPGAELVLVNRAAQVKAHMRSIPLRKSTSSRQYNGNSGSAGSSSGYNAAGSRSGAIGAGRRAIGA